ncbi:hypothetical protein PanWU01x14_115570 [Parasponia andersonii]|uniref:Uncharacterized protein n=1 Tax=Parasponia andersonii TaxID=3476 RepID=A0A2P5CX35_PARAD|nr:hypothetical protein PanWU01x14_115570 [Parasponia andersonii]
MCTCAGRWPRLGHGEGHHSTDGSGMNKLKDKVMPVKEIIKTSQSNDANSLIAQAELQEAEIRSIQSALRDFIKDHIEQGVKDLISAIAVANSLLDFSPSHPSHPKRREDRNNKMGKAQTTSEDKKLGGGLNGGSKKETSKEEGNSSEDTCVRVESSHYKGNLASRMRRPHQFQMACDGLRCLRGELVKRKVIEGARAILLMSPR